MAGATYVDAAGHVRVHTVLVAKRWWSPSARAAVRGGFEKRTYWNLEFTVAALKMQWGLGSIVIGFAGECKGGKCGKGKI